VTDDGERAYFSQYNDKVDVAAPGVMSIDYLGWKIRQVMAQYGRFHASGAIAESIGRFETVQTYKLKCHIFTHQHLRQD
jgi:hypothetical protein